MRKIAMSIFGLLCFFAPLLTCPMLFARDLTPCGQGTGFACTMHERASTADEAVYTLAQTDVIDADSASAFKQGAGVKEQSDPSGKQEGLPVTTSSLFRLSGYAQIRYQEPEHATAGFDVHRARLILSGTLTDRIDYDLQPAFEGTEPKLLDAYVDYRAGGCLKFTAGQFKIPFSRENLIASSILETIDRSQVVEALVARSRDIIGNQSGRDIGVKVSGGFLERSGTDLLEYAVAVLNGQGIDTADLNDQKDYVGRLLIHPIKGLSLGGGYYTGRAALYGVTGSTYERTRTGAELAYVHEPVSLRAEYIRGRDGTQNGVITGQGWYVQGTHSFLTNRLQCVLKYDAYDPDINVPHNTSTVYTIGLNWFFTPLTRIQVNYGIQDVQGARQNGNLLAVQAQAGF